MSRRLCLAAALLAAGCQTAAPLPPTVQPVRDDSGYRTVSCEALARRIAALNDATHKVWLGNARISDAQAATGAASLIPIVGLGAAALTMAADAGKSDDTQLVIARDEAQDALLARLASGRCGAAVRQVKAEG